jgi:hypothetical protein
MVDRKKEPMSKLFHLSVDAFFEADDADDAFKRVGRYFSCGTGDLDKKSEKLFWRPGHILLDECMCTFPGKISDPHCGYHYPERNR